MWDRGTDKVIEFKYQLMQLVLMYIFYKTNKKIKTFGPLKKNIFEIYDQILMKLKDRF